MIQAFLLLEHLILFIFDSSRKYNVDSACLRSALSEGLSRLHWECKFDGNFITAYPYKSHYRKVQATFTLVDVSENESLCIQSLLYLDSRSPPRPTLFPELSEQIWRAIEILLNDDFNSDLSDDR